MSRNVPQIHETRYQRASGPAVLVTADPVDRAWLRACRAYRRSLCAGTIPVDSAGPARTEFLPAADHEREGLAA